MKVKSLKTKGESSVSPRQEVITQVLNFAAILRKRAKCGEAAMTAAELEKELEQKLQAA